VSQQKQAEAQQEKELLRQQLDDLTVQVALATLIAPPPRIWLQTSLFVSQLREANEKRMHDSATIDHFTAQLTAESNARRLADSDLRVAKERVRPYFLPLRLVARTSSQQCDARCRCIRYLPSAAGMHAHTHAYLRMTRTHACQKSHALPCDSPKLAALRSHTVDRGESGGKGGSCEQS
jgi:hypothetical protein